MIDLENNTSSELEGNIKLLQGPGSLGAGSLGAAVQAKGVGLSDIKIEDEPKVLNTIDEPISETIVIKKLQKRNLKTFIKLIS